MSIEAGTILRETREQKGVSIKEASDALHIRIPYLQALENGRAEIIPSVVQARGFLRIYSEYLGINSADIIQEWDKPGTTRLSGKNVPDVSINREAFPADRSVSQNYGPYPPMNRNTIGTNPPLSGYNTGAPDVIPNIQTIPMPPDSAIPSRNSGTESMQPSPQVYPQNPVPMNDAEEPAPPEEGKKKNRKKEAKKSKKSGSFHLFKKKKTDQQQKPDQEVTAQSLFLDIGEQLSVRRKLLALSLEDCESQTLIRSIYLESMEEGKFEELPSLIQARGMLNNYASFLDLDVDAIMLKFATALQLLSQKKNRRDEEKKHKPTKTAGRLKKFFTPDLFVGVFVIVGIAGIIIYSAITITAYRRSVSEPTPDFGISLLDQYMETTRTPDFLPTTSPTPFIVSQSSRTGAEASETEEVTENSMITSSQPVQLFVTANQRALMTVLSDGKEVFSGRTLPNNTYPFDAENLIELTISNADAISVVYNQQNLGRLGKLGEVMTVDFSPFMAATPTPQFSPTPTNTYEPTYTPQPETPLPTNTPTPYIP